MSESSAAVPRRHAGCGHLCLTCGARAVHRYIKGPASPLLKRVTSVMYFLALASPVVSGLCVGGWLDGWLSDRQKPVPPPDVQHYWSDGTPSLQYMNAIADQRAFTLIADADGRVAFSMPEGKVCIASAGDAGSLYSAVAGRHRVFWGARPNTVIHVGCW